MVSYCLWLFRKLVQHSAQPSRSQGEQFRRSWRKVHFCLQGGSLSTGPVGPTTAATPGVIIDMTESIFSPTSHSKPPDSCKRLCFIITVVWGATRPSWCLYPWTGLPGPTVYRKAGQQDSRLAATYCVPCMLWLKLKRRLLLWVWPSTVAIGGPAGVTQKCRGKVLPMEDRSSWINSSVFPPTGGLFWDMIISLKMSWKIEQSTILATKLWPVWECTSFELALHPMLPHSFPSLLFLWDDTSH